MGRSRPVPSVKVSPPRVQALGRERLNELLERVWEHRLGIVIAPAGSGKTTLLAQFALESGVPVAWYRAEDSDFSTAALLRHLERSVTATLGKLSGDWTTVEGAATALESWDVSRALLIVDDLHALEGTEAEAALERLIDYLPPSIRMLAAARRSPRFNLSRLRVSGELLELGSDDLRFRSWEVEQLFRNIYREPMSPEDLAELARRTEGWAAGLQLFHLATRSKPPRERRDTLTALGYGAKPVREYLARNALEELGDELKEFMLQTSLLGRLSGQLCDEFLSRTGSGQILEELERRQIFTQRVDDLGNFRYHEVLRSHLEIILLDQIGEVEAAERFRRAAKLLEVAGAIPEALRAYCRAEDWEAAARLLGREGEHLAEDPGEWIHSLPSAVLDHDPWLLLMKARRYFASGRLRDALETYQLAEAGFGSVAARDICARERRAVSTWLKPEHPLASDWVSLVRSATQRDPAGVARRAASLPGDTGKFVAGLAACLAGQVRLGRELLSKLADRAEVNPILEVVARFASALASRMGGRAGLVDEFEKAAEDAEKVGIPWLTRVARAATALAGGVDGMEEARAMRDASMRAGDEWGAALAALIEGIGGLWSGTNATEVLEESARSFQDLGAGVFEAWARSLIALSMTIGTNQNAEKAGEVAADAELHAKAVGVPGAHALALLALGALDGPKAAESLALGMSLSEECGLRPRLEIMAAPDRNGPASRISIRCFGRFSIEVDGLPVQIGGVKPRAREVLKIIAMNGGRPVHRDVLIEAVWPDADVETGTRGLHVAISSLRQVLEPGIGRGASRFLVREDGAYRLAVPEEGSVDVATFDAAVSEARAAKANGNFDAASVALTYTLDTYTGELLPEVGPAEWVVKDRERYRTEAAEAAQLLAEVRLDRGDPGGAAASAERGLAIDGYRDDLWRLLIHSYELSGNLASAKRAQQAYEQALAELGLEPSDASG